jgi:two-component system, NtrC family, sensor kinase
MLSNISYRYKIPASLSLVIIVTALAVAVPLISGTNETTKRDLVDHALSLGKTLAGALQPALLHDDMWQAYEIITTPFDRALQQRLGQPTIVVVDAQGAVYVASDPKRFPATQRLASLGPVSAKLAETLSRPSDAPLVLEDLDPELSIMAVPVLSNDQTQLGTVVLEYSRDIYRQRFLETIRKVAASAAITLAILVPLGWLWGKQIASPLLRLSSAIRQVARAPAATVAFNAPAGRDEIAELGATFNSMVDGLREREALKEEVLASERLAAIGRLTAGIAHEINNPLGGMLNAISTYKRQRSGMPAFVDRTMSLLERGLTQIRETVAALLVEARLESRALTPHDIEDVHTLLLHNVQGKHVRLDWQNDVTEPLPLPSTEVRQILLNLLLNAVEAVDQHGRVSSAITPSDTELKVRIENDGANLTDDQLQRLFEPFAESRHKGKGLGLWMTYQLATQLRGRIEAQSKPGQTVFTVTLPIAA